MAMPLAGYCGMFSFLHVYFCKSIMFIPTPTVGGGAIVFRSVAGPTVWKSLPDYLRDPSLSEDTFRRSLKTYLFALY